VVEGWDYIPPIVADAATQMAIDAELAEICNQSGRGAFLRFYSMSPPAVTIGRNQQWRAVIDPELCQRNGWDWVRRPTGGGALLHHQEINYAVAVAHDMFDCPSGDARQSVFHHVAEGLLAGLTRLGFQPRLSVTRKSPMAGELASAHGLCGSALTRHEISVEGMKAVAAAQWNLSKASLQHGTIYLQAPGPGDRFWPEGADRTSPGPQWWACDHGTSLPHDRWLALADALKEGLAQVLGIRWREDPSDWVGCSAISTHKERWRASGWHERR